MSTKKRILIVEDDKNLRRIMRIILKDLSIPHEIEEACDGFVAKRKIEKFCPDLIILDKKMPKRGGYEVCLDLRNNPDTQRVKIIGISAYGEKIGEVVMSSLGVDYYFEKPFDHEKFKNKVEELLRES